LCQGIDVELSRSWRAGPLAITYAGGARSLEDLNTVTAVSGGRVDLTIGSALDIFGGTGVRYADCVALNRRWASKGRDRTDRLMGRIGRIGGSGHGDLALDNAG